MRRMTRTAVRTPQTASGHISIDIISHLGADLEQTPKLCRCWLWATTDTGKGPSRANYSSRMQVPAGFVLGQRPQGTFAHLKDSWIGVERGFLPRPQARLCYNKFVVISRRYQWPQPQSRQPFQKPRPKPRRSA